MPTILPRRSEVSPINWLATSEKWRVPPPSSHWTLTSRSSQQSCAHAKNSNHMTRFSTSTEVARCLLITLIIFCFRRAFACRALASISFFSGEEVLGRPTFFGATVLVIFCIALVLRMSRNIVCCLWNACYGAIALISECSPGMERLEVGVSTCASTARCLGPTLVAC